MTDSEIKKIEEELIQMSDFLLLAKTIQRILNNLESLYGAGYPRDQQIFKKANFECILCNFDEIIEFERDSANELAEWLHTLTEVYNSSYFMTFVT